jgi:hypothetical protein
MLPGKRSRFVHGLLAVVVVVGLAGPALGQDLLTVRVESLDAALGDVTTIAAAAGQPMTKDQLLAPMLSQLGIDDLSFLDWKSPAAMVMPMQGMMLQQKGLLLALPVADAEKAIELLASKFASHAVEEDLHVLSTDAGPQLYVASHDGYLTAGGSKDLLRGFDLSAALSRPDAPPGNLVVDFNVEPIAPMAMMGMMQAKEMMKQQMTAAMQADANVPPGMPAMMGSMVDMYIDLAQALLNNMSRLQLVPEVDGSNVIAHIRVVPKAGTTLAGMVAAQNKAWPALARHVSGEGVLVAAGQMTMTPEAKEFAKTMVARYCDALGQLGAGMSAVTEGGEGEGGGEEHQDPMHAAMMKLMSSFPAGLEELYVNSLDCYTGAMAFSLDLDPEQGVSFTQVEGFDGSKEGCADMTATALGMVRDWIGEVPELASLVSIGPTGTGSDWAIDVDLGAHLAEAPEEAKAMLNQLILDDGKFSVRVGQAKGLAYGVFGKDAAARAADIAKGTAAGGGGIKADAFSPLPPGAGYYFRVDAGRLLGALQQIVPPEESGELAQIAQAFTGPAGQIPMAFRFDSGGINFEAAVSLKTVEAIAGLAQAEKHYEKGHEEHHEHSHGEEGGAGTD